MNAFLFLVKLLTGGVSVALALLFILFVFIFIRCEWTSIKLRQRKDLNKLKHLVIITVLFISFVIGFLILGYYYPLIAFSIWLIWFVTRGRKYMGGYYGEPTKGRSLTRKKMEELRQAHQETPMTKKEAIKYRNARNKMHRANFLNRLAKR